MDKIRSELIQTLMSRLRPLSIRNELHTLEFTSLEIENCLSLGIPENENDPKRYSGVRFLLYGKTQKGNGSATLNPDLGKEEI